MCSENCVNKENNIKKYRLIIWFLIATSFQAASARLISENGIGSIELGQTLKQIKHAQPKMQLQRERDAEGAEYISLLLTPHTVVLAHFDDTQPAKIDFLQTFSPNCQTRDGVRPNMRLQQVAQKWGSLKNITMSEIEMREFAEFEKQP